MLKENKKYYYGVSLLNNELTSFVMESLPKNVLDYKIGYFYNVFYVKKLARQMLQNYQKSFNNYLYPGKIVIHYDGRGKNHICILLRKIEKYNEWQALVLTSKSHRFNYLRKATKEELALIGFVCTREKTFLSAFKRHEDEFFVNNDISYSDQVLAEKMPLHRVAALFNEFYLK